MGSRRGDSDRAFWLNVLGTLLAMAAVALVFVVGTLAGSVDWQSLAEPSVEVAMFVAVWLSPVAFSALPLLLRRRHRTAKVMRFTAGGALWLFTIATFTVFYMPAAMAMFLAGGFTPGGASQKRAA